MNENQRHGVGWVAVAGLLVTFIGLLVQLATWVAPDFWQDVRVSPSVLIAVGMGIAIISHSLLVLWDLARGHGWLGSRTTPTTSEKRSAARIRMWNPILGVILLILLWVYAVFVVPASGQVRQAQTTDPLAGAGLSAPASLVGIEFEARGWNPRLVDLRTAAESGIPISAGDTLAFPNLWIRVSSSIPTRATRAWVKTFADEDRTHLVGTTEAVRVEEGVHSLGFLHKGGESGIETREWRTQADWIGNYLYFAVFIEQDEGPVLTEVTMVKLSPDGTAWFLDPPYLSIASVVYRINDEPSQTLRFDGDTTDEIQAALGDRLQIEEIWLREVLLGRTRSGTFARAEAYLTSEGWNSNTWVASGDLALGDEFSHFAELSEFQWVLEPEHKKLVISAARDQRAVSDTLTIPIHIKE